MWHKAIWKGHPMRSFLSNVHVFLFAISPVCLLKYPLFFFPFLFSNFSCSSICSYNDCYWLLFEIFFRSFYCISQFIEIWHLRNPRCSQVLFLLFLTHTVCLCHFSRVSQCAWSSILMSFGPFFLVLPFTIVRIVPSILQGGLPLFIPLTKFRELRNYFYFIIIWIFHNSFKWCFSLEREWQ